MVGSRCHWLAEEDLQRIGVGSRLASGRRKVSADVPYSRFDSTRQVRTNGCWLMLYKLGCLCGRISAHVLFIEYWLMEDQKSTWRRVALEGLLPDQVKSWWSRSCLYGQRGSTEWCLAWKSLYLVAKPPNSVGEKRSFQYQDIIWLSRGHLDPTT